MSRSTIPLAVLLVLAACGNADEPLNDDSTSGPDTQACSDCAAPQATFEGDAYVASEADVARLAGITRIAGAP